jgi:putative flippase GtrA
VITANTRRQLTRFASVGIASNLLLFLGYLSLTRIGVGHKTSMTLVYCLGISATFVANRSWSFGHRGMAHSAFARYVISYALGYILNLGFLWITVDRLRFPHQGAQAVAIVLVALNLFVLHKYWVFAPSVTTKDSA